MSKEFANFERREDTSYERTWKRAETAALRLIRERFEVPKNPLDRMEYHVQRHTHEVVHRAKKILAVLRELRLISEKEEALGIVSAAFHDTVQEYDIVEEGSGDALAKKRVRRRGDNEDKSAEEAVMFLKGENRHREDDEFGEADFTLVRNGIWSTFPAYDTKLGTVVQPRMRAHYSLAARAVAMADLNGVGMEESENYMHEGDALFREENIDVAESLANLDSLSPPRRDFLRSRMLGFTKIQISFAKGREIAFKDDLAAFPAEARRRIEELFPMFVANGLVAEEVYARRSKLSLEQLARDMGYDI